MKLRLMVIGALAAAPLLFGAAAANAAPAAGSSVCVSTTGAIACYQPNGDYFSSYDTAEDGHHTVTFWSTSTGRQGKCENFGGNGTRATCNETITHPAGSSVCFRAGVYEGDTQIRISGRECYLF